jgi:hypothetical protein
MALDLTIQVGTMTSNAERVAQVVHLKLLA